MVEGTPAYSALVHQLQKVVGSFTLARSRSKHPLIDKQLPAVTTVPTFVQLTGKQRALYDDYLAKPNTQVSLNKDINKDYRWHISFLITTPICSV